MSSFLQHHPQGTVFPGSLLNEHFSWVAVGESWAGNQGFESLPASAAENCLHIWPWVSCLILLLSLAPQRNGRQGCWARGSAVGKGYWDLLCVPTCWVFCASSICHVAPQGPCPCLLVTALHQSAGAWHPLYTGGN